MYNKSTNSFKFYLSRERGEDLKEREEKCSSTRKEKMFKEVQIPELADYARVKVLKLSERHEFGRRGQAQFDSPPGKIRENSGQFCSASGLHSWGSSRFVRRPMSQWLFWNMSADLRSTHNKLVLTGSLRTGVEPRIWMGWSENPSDRPWLRHVLLKIVLEAS